MIATRPSLLRARPCWNGCRSIASDKLGDRFGIGEVENVIVGTPPGGPLRMSFQGVVDEHVAFDKAVL
jgi:hypothetical protein